MKRRNTSCAAQKNVQKIKKNTLTKDLPVPEKIITVPKIKKSLSPPKETPSPEKARSDGILTAKIDNSNHRTEVSEGREDESEKVSRYSLLSSSESVGDFLSLNECIERKETEGGEDKPCLFGEQIRSAMRIPLRMYIREVRSA